MQESLRLQAPSADLRDSYRSLICGKPNLGSARIILDNGGVLESEEFSAERGEVVQRYWINLKS